MATIGQARAGFNPQLEAKRKLQLDGRMAQQGPVNFSGKGVGASGAAATGSPPQPVLGLNAPGMVTGAINAAKGGVDTVVKDVKDRYPGGVTGGAQSGGNSASPTAVLTTRPPPMPTFSNAWAGGGLAPPAGGIAPPGGGFGFNFPSPGAALGSLGGINIFQLLQQMGLFPSNAALGMGGGGSSPGNMAGGGGGGMAYPWNPSQAVGGYENAGAPPAQRNFGAMSKGGSGLTATGPDGRQMAGSIQAQTNGLSHDPTSALSRFWTRTDIQNLRDNIDPFNVRNSAALRGLGDQVGDLSQAGYLGTWSRDAARQASQDAISRERDAALRNISGRAGRGGVVGTGDASGVYSGAMRAGKEAELALNDRAYQEEMSRMGQLGQARGALAGAQTMGNQIDNAAEMDQITSNKELLGLLLGFLPEMADAAIPF